jgi:hypothetical protein
MHTLSQITWMTLWGLSFLFVGGFVLWVYGSQRENLASDESIPQGASSPYLHARIVRWFLIYGALAVFAGIGLLLTAAVFVI